MAIDPERVRAGLRVKVLRNRVDARVPGFSVSRLSSGDVLELSGEVGVSPRVPELGLVGLYSCPGRRCRIASSEVEGYRIFEGHNFVPLSDLEEWNFGLESADWLLGELLGRS